MTKEKIEAYVSPAGGWGSVKSLVTILGQEHVPLSGPLLLRKQNKRDGFMCVSCAWAKPDPPHPFEFCENGAKATVWEQTSKRVGPDFFDEHTVSELLTWSDHNLEEQGRLTHPLRYDAGTDRYRPVSWEDAFAEIGRELNLPDPLSTARAVRALIARRRLEPAGGSYRLLDARPLEAGERESVGRRPRRKAVPREAASAAADAGGSASYSDFGRATVDRLIDLGRENAELRAEVRQLREEAREARATRDEAERRARSLAERGSDRGLQPGSFKRQSLGRAKGPIPGPVLQPIAGRPQ
jgi:anaerobic selenocysteine-containing dehydrogenase